MDAIGFIKGLGVGLFLVAGAYMIVAVSFQVNQLFNQYKRAKRKQ